MTRKNRFKTKIISLAVAMIFALTFSFSGFLPLIAAQAAELPSLTIEKAELTPGESFSIPIIMTSSGEVGGLQFDLAFDPDVVSITSVTRGNLTGGNNTDAFIVQSNTKLETNSVGQVTKIRAIIANIAPEDNTAGLPAYIPAGSDSLVILSGIVNASAKPGQSSALTFSDVKMTNKPGEFYIENTTFIDEVKVAGAAIINVTGVSLNKTEAIINKNDVLQLTAVVVPSEATDSSATWLSSNETVATVSTTGLVTALREGSTNITVTTNDGGFTASCAITVQEATAPLATPPSLSVNVQEITIGEAVYLNFSDDSAWRNAITDIAVNNTALEENQYSIDAGVLIIDANVFTEVGAYNIVVTATGYEDSFVIQTVRAAVTPPDINQVELVLSPNNAIPGETVVASGKGPADTWISLRVLDEDNAVVVFDAAQTDGAGNYSFTFTVPAVDGERLIVITGYGTNIAREDLTLKLDAPVLYADTSNNVVGQTIELSFADDADWRSAINSVSVNGSALASGQYTVSAGVISFIPDVFTSVGSYNILVMATGYKDAFVTQAIAAKTPPVLVADSSDNLVSQIIDLTYLSNSDWQSAVNMVKVNGTALTPGNQYTISDGVISIASGVFDVPGSYNIVVSAANYSDAAVTQIILGVAPILTADTTNNAPEQVIEITFIDNADWRNNITGVTVDGHSITGKYTLTSGTLILNESVFTAIGNYNVVVKANGYTDTSVSQEILSPCYNIVPELDSVYIISENEYGIKLMTVNSGNNGLRYFNVQVNPVRSHNGDETLVFTHTRDGAQQSLNSVRTDFDLVSKGSAGFNVKADDVVKVYIVDQLTNDLNLNPIIYQ